MTDEQITKALECCIDSNCYSCPDSVANSTGNCEHNLMRDALDLINRQKSTINELTKAYKSLKSEKNAVIESLQHYKLLYEELKDEHLETIKLIKNAESEAIKEFVKEFVADLSHMLTYDKDYIKAKIFHLMEIKTK